MAYYVMEEMPDIHKKGERVLYPRFAMTEQVSTETVAKTVAERSSFTVGDIEGVLKEVATEIARQMAHGNSVKIDGIGTFSPSLALRVDKEREEAGEDATHRNARSIVVGKVNLRVDMDLLRNTNIRCSLERAPWKTRRSSQKYTAEERLTMALKHLEEHPFLTVGEYQQMTGLLHTTAANELKHWSEQDGSGIDTSGRGSHRVYVRKPEPVISSQF